METLTIYFDGRCPLCLAEIHVLRARNRRGLLQFVDVAAQDYRESSHGVSCDAALATIHARLGDHRLLRGPAVFAEAYRRADLTRSAWLFSRPALQPLLGFAYRQFARHRHAISRFAGPLLLRIARRLYP
jgi:predicted DCC family thiol-disulfide oxidoreductase YuxK